MKQGALILFSRWCYHRTSPRLVEWPAGFERTLQVARWVRPDARINVYEQPKDKTGGNVRSGALELSGTVKTYRYLDETEVQEQQKAEADAEYKKMKVSYMVHFVLHIQIFFFFVFFSLCGPAQAQTTL